MPFKYIGQTTDFKGKSLWEIVGNLKNFGVGRIVARSRMERYSEPTYLKILKVEPLPCPEVQTMNNIRKVRVHVERTFRGKTFPVPKIIESSSYKTDYKLIPKDEEKDYCRKVELKTELPVLPKMMRMPPILRELVIRDMQNNGEDASQEPLMEAVYNTKHCGSKFLISEDGKPPTVELDSGIKHSLYHSTLYKNIKVV